jgi:hypothetical protein
MIKKYYLSQAHVIRYIARFSMFQTGLVLYKIIYTLH